MKCNKSIILFVFILLIIFVTGCVAPGANNNTDQDFKTPIGDINKSAAPVSAMHFWKMNKAGSNLAWAAAAKMAIVSQRYKFDPYIKDRVWQGDLSSFYFRGDRNTKPSKYWDGSTTDFKSIIVAAIGKYATVGANWDRMVPGSSNVFKDRFYSILYLGVPIIVIRKDKNNENNFWPVVIYAMPDTTKDHEKISVWDPEHGWDYTCDLKSFCDDARYYDHNKNGQIAIWPKYGAYDLLGAPYKTIEHL